MNIVKVGCPADNQPKITYYVVISCIAFEPCHLYGCVINVKIIVLGAGKVGSAGHFAAFSALPKLLLSFDMLAGRLEFFPILLLFAGTTWKR